MAHKINELVEKIKNLSETEYYRIKIEEKSPGYSPGFSNNLYLYRTMEVLLEEASEDG